jgi:murein DD-endopeptidase MepM/ murein hydrolase activator NlpD
MKNIVKLLAVAAGLLLLIKLIKRMTQPINPVTGKISSKFGRRKAPTPGASTIHNGVDIAVPVGTEVKSPWDGTVLQTYANDAGGRQMIVAHTNGYRTGYAHLSAYRARAGQKVKAGDTICLSGNTGHSTGPHLHFTLTNPDGAKIDPESIFNFND